MTIKITKLTDEDLMRRACEFTTGKTSYAKLDTMYKAEHSPIRTQLFWIEMYDIPSFVSTHLVRHNVGVVHFVKTNREDRGGDTKADRWTPVNHAMLINAQELITMSHRRLCMKTHKETFNVMVAIRQKLIDIDVALALEMQPMCEYRGHVCYEPFTCGRCAHYKNN